MEHGRLQTVVTYLRRLSRPPHSPQSDRELLQAFAAEIDEVAFATLVERHAGMVLGICRRILRDHQAAEDATQATFFVLARKAGRVRWRESVAPWLASVAYRIALKARGLAPSHLESPRRELPSSAPPADQQACFNEMHSIIDDEIQRLPQRLRSPVVLCYLEGRSYEQAALALGWRASTLKGRLEKARGLLRSRLQDRGLLFGVVLPPSLLEAFLEPALVPGNLPASISRVAVLVQAGEAATSALLSPTVYALMSCPMPVVPLTKLGVVLTLILVAGAGIVGGAVFGRRDDVKEAAQSKTVQERATAQFEKPALPKQGANDRLRVDRFGDPLPEHAIGRFGTTRLRHGNAVRFLRFTPDGKTLVSQAEDGVRTWNAANAAALRFFSKEIGSSAGSEVDLSPDGKLLAAPGKSSIGLWDVDSGRPLRTIGSGSYSRVCFSPDGALLASVGGPDTSEIKLWDTVSGRLLRAWKENPGPITSLLFAGDAKTLITGNTAWRPPLGREQNHISSWDTATGKEKGRIDLAGFGPSKIVASADGKLLAALCRTNMVSHVAVWDFASGNEIWRLEPGPMPPGQPGRPMELCTLTFFPNGKLLIAGQGDDSLVTWSATQGIEKRKLDRDLALSGVLAVSQDGKTVAASPPGGAIRLIEWDTGRDRIPEIAESYHDLVGIAADCQSIVVRGRQSMSVWQPATGNERKLFERPAIFWRARLTTDLRHVQTWEERPRSVTVRAVSTWDLATGREVQRIQSAKKTDGLLYPLALSPDGKTLALLDIFSRPQPDAVVIMDMGTGKAQRTLTGNLPMALRGSFTPDGLRLVVWSPGNPCFLHVWDMALGQRLWKIEYQGADLAGGFEPVISPDGKRVLAAGLNRSLVIYDLTTGELVRSIDKLADAPHAVAFSADGRCVAWGGNAIPIVSVVELATGRERLRLPGHEGKITNLCFSDDGKILASYSGDNTALAWDLTGRVEAGPNWNKQPSFADFEACWADLGSEEASRACKAIQRFLVEPTSSVAFLETHVVPASDREATPAEKLRELRLVETVEKIGGSAGSRLLEAWAAGDSKANLTREARAALKRLNELETRDSRGVSQSK